MDKLLSDGEIKQASAENVASTKQTELAAQNMHEVGRTKELVENTRCEQDLRMDKNAAFLKKLLATFKVEAEEHVRALSSGLLELEAAPEAARAELWRRSSGKHTV